MTIMEIERTAVEQLTGGRVHSAVASAHLQWVRDYHGGDAVKELFWRLDGAVSDDLAADDGWVSFGALVAPDRAIESRYGRGRRGFLRGSGRL